MSLNKVLTWLATEDSTNNLNAYIMVDDKSHIYLDIPILKELQSLSKEDIDKSQPLSILLSNFSKNTIVRAKVRLSDVGGYIGVTNEGNLVPCCPTCGSGSFWNLPFCPSCKNQIPNLIPLKKQSLDIYQSFINPEQKTININANSIEDIVFEDDDLSITSKDLVEAKLDIQKYMPIKNI